MDKVYNIMLGLHKIILIGIVSTIDSLINFFTFLANSIEKTYDLVAFEEKLSGQKGFDKKNQDFLNLDDVKIEYPDFSKFSATQLANFLWKNEFTEMVSIEEMIDALDNRPVLVEALCKETFLKFHKSLVELINSNPSITISISAEEE